MKLLKISAIVALSSVSSVAMAEQKNTLSEVFTDGNPMSISAEIGTFGYGANIGWSVDDAVELQLGYSGGDLVSLAGDDADLELDDVKYDVATDFSAPYIGVQIRPLKNWLTIGTGVMFINDSKLIDANVQPATDVEVTYDGQDYIAKANDSQINSTIGFNNAAAPYATLGFRPNINNRFGLFAEVGAAYTKGVVVDVDAQGTFTLPDGTTASLDDTAFASQKFELEANAESEIRQNLKGEGEQATHFYPIIKAGATLRF